MFDSLNCFRIFIHLLSIINIYTQSKSFVALFSNRIYRLVSSFKLQPVNQPHFSVCMESSVDNSKYVCVCVCAFLAVNNNVISRDILRKERKKIHSLTVSLSFCAQHILYNSSPVLVIILSIFGWFPFNSSHKIIISFISKFI